MRFVCDSCRAQYMISDDKVGAKGVKVRCKKCGYNIVVRPAGSAPAKEEGTSGEAAGGAAASQGQSNSDGFGLPASLGTPPEGGIFSGVEDDELGAVFDQVLNSGSHRIPAGEKVGDGPAPLDASALSDAGETVRKLAEAETGSIKPAAAHEWFVAIDEKQVGPLSLEKVKDYWERGEVGPDSLCWRAGFSDWIPLSEASELASVLAPRPTRPVIVEPAPVVSSSPVASGPVESAFSAGGGFSKSPKADTPAPVAPSAQDSGWKPSAASVLASLVKEENEALSKPAPKASPVVEERAKPAASGLLDVPPPEPAPVAAQSPLMAEPPAPYMQPAPAYAQPHPQAYAQPMAQPYPPPQQYAQPHPQAYPGYPPAAPAPKQGGKMGMIIGIAVGVVLLVGGVGIFFATRPAAQPVQPVVTQPQQVAQAPSKPAELPPMPPPPAATAQNTPPAAGTTAQPATAPATAPTTAPAVAAAGTPGTAPAANPTPPPSEPVKPAESAKTEPQQVARAEVPSTKRTPTTTTRPVSHSTASKDDEEPAPRPTSKPPPSGKSGGSADDEFDELFGAKKPSGGTKPDTASANGRTAYIPPEPGGGGAALEKLGQSDIMQVVLANKPAIIKCVNEQKKKDPGLSGKLVMRWTIQTNGKTKNVSCQTSEFRSTYMASCISGLIKGWNFPKHRVQGDPIDFPFTF
ncbi:adventurous gliding motility protein GltJ [Archangium sp.]|uniref:adventurous gliding motility protein GltJ n=1 Tax=Archangium sp. TaxID=1872627 RepID=UPI00389A0645